MIIKNNELFLYVNDKLKEIYYKYLISDKKIIKKRFKKRLGREVNLVNPLKYNDKLQWLKLNWYDPLATKCADKYEVREIIEKTIGSEYLNKIYGVYESVDEINLDKLPKSFVLKGTHGSGYNIICKDKNEMNWEQEFKKMRRWLRTNYYYSKREWVYKDIKPRIICERYLSDETGQPPMDYKIFCFHGEPKLIQVDVDRFGGHKQNFYEIDWAYKNIEIEVPSEKGIQVTKPKELDRMLELSRQISKDFPHVRVDFYEVKGQVIFGELTFFHHSGMGKFNPPEYEIEMGNYLKLPLRGN
jgi:hypothetical protein